MRTMKPVVEPYGPLREGAVVDLGNASTLTADVLIVGSGMGGAATAHALAESGLDVLVVERGDFLPREPENADPAEMYVKKRYRNSEPWYDGSNGDTFYPGTYHWVGGNTKFYGASLPRFRAEDFEERAHHDGISPKWPFSYDDLEPYYTEVERLFQVHGSLGEDPTEPRHSEEYPSPALPHEPSIQRLSDSFAKQGLRPFHTPNGMNAETMVERRSNKASDGNPSSNDVKSDAENRLLRPALESKTVRLLTNAKVTKLLTSDDGTRVVAALAVVAGKTVRLEAKQFVVSAGAVNTAVLLMKSSNAQHDRGLGNSSDLLGRNYMVHNSTFFVAFNPFRLNDTAWQKTLGLNDWYLPTADTPFPLGNVQMLGKLQGATVKGFMPWAPTWMLDIAVHRSVDLYLTTEDMPLLENRVRVDGDRTIIDWKPTNVEPHRELVRRVSRAVRRAGYPFIATQRMGIATNSHMCGTAVAGHDPASSVLNANCRTHDVDNLWVVDGSFFPSSAALNPALTIAANALRVSGNIVEAARTER